MIQKIIAYIDT